MRVLIAFLAAALLAMPVLAQGLPQAVADAYRGYEAAVDAEDWTEAARQAEIAWRAAEENGVAPETTTILAANFGEVALISGDFESGAEAFGRASELGQTLNIGADTVGMYELSAARANQLLSRHSVAMRGALSAAGHFESLTDVEQRASGMYQAYRVAALAANGAEITNRAGQHAQRALDALWEIGPIANEEVALLAFLAASRAFDSRDYDTALFYVIVSRAIASELEMDIQFAETSYELQVRSMLLTDREDFDRVFDSFRASGYVPGRCFYVHHCIDEPTSPEVESVAIPLLRTPPDYPSTAFNYNDEGYVDVQFDVTADGRTENIQVVEASNDVFIRPAIEAVEYWRYWPQRVNGVDVPRRGVQTRLDFQLDE